MDVISEFTVRCQKIQRRATQGKNPVSRGAAKHNPLFYEVLTTVVRVESVYKTKVLRTIQHRMKGS